jgi:hypothetical protein
MPKTRKVKRGGIPRDVVEGLADAYQKGVADAKMGVLKRYQTPPGFRLEQVIPPLVRKHPDVTESRIREEYVKGFTETRRPIGSSRRKTMRGGISKQLKRAFEQVEELASLGLSREAIMNSAKASGFVRKEDQELIADKYEAAKRNLKVTPGVRTLGYRASGGVSKEMVDALRSAETQGRTDKQNGVSSRADAIAGSIMNQFRLADFGTPSPRTLLRDKYTASYQQTPASGLPSGMPPSLQSIVDRLRALAS